MSVALVNFSRGDAETRRVLSGEIAAHALRVSASPREKPITPIGAKYALAGFAL